MNRPPQPPLPAVTTVLFDVDNTLIPTRRIWRNALDTVAARLADAHPEASAADIAAAYVRASDRLWGDYDRALAPLGSHTAARQHVWEVALHEAGIDLAQRQLATLVADFAHRQMRAIRPDRAVDASFRRLVDVYRLGVVTNGDTVHQPAKLGRSGLDRYFQTVVCALGNGRRKPDPAPFWQACDNLGVRPEQCLYVGDEWDTDIVGARAAGMHPVWISPAPDQPPPDAPPTTHFTSLTAVLDALCAHAVSQPISETEPT